MWWISPGVAGKECRARVVVEAVVAVVVVVGVATAASTVLVGVGVGVASAAATAEHVATIAIGEEDAEVVAAVFRGADMCTVVVTPPTMIWTLATMGRVESPPSAFC